MYLSDKIMLLRKKAGLTQEELAELLEVSRQSVSKWENGTSIPDMEKIVRLSDVFLVSTDALLRDDISVESEEVTTEVLEPTSEQAPLFPVSLDMAQDFLHDTRVQTKKTALGILCFVLSPGALIFLGLLAEETGNAEAPSFLFGFIALAVLITLGLYLVISSQIKLKPYEPLQTEPLDTAYGVTGLAQREMESSTPIFIRKLVLSIGLFIISPVPLILADYLYPSIPLSVAVGIVLLLLIVSVGLFILIPAASYRSALQQLLETEDYTRAKKSNSFLKIFTQVYWAVVTAAYLIYSLLTHDWGRSWVVWPAAAIAFSAIAIIVEHIGNKKNQGTSK